MPTSNAKIEQLARALLPRYGVKDVPSLVATIVKYRSRDGHVKISRPEGGWSWYASPGVTAATPSLVTLRFPADHRRDTAQARDDLYRQLEDASLSVMSEDEIEAATTRPRRAAAVSRLRGTRLRGTRSEPVTTEPVTRSVAQIEREVEALRSSSSPSLPSPNLGMARAERLAEALRALGHEAEAFRQYGIWNSVGVHRVGPGTAGEWRQVVTFFDDGRLQPPAGGPAYGTGNPWRHGREHDLVEEVASWVP